MLSKLLPVLLGCARLPQISLQLKKKINKLIYTIKRFEILLCLIKCLEYKLIKLNFVTWSVFPFMGPHMLQIQINKNSKSGSK